MTTIPRIRIDGPLVPFVGRVWSHLLAQGYAPRSSENLLRLVSHLSRWLVDAGLRLNDLTRERIDAFFADRKQAGYKHHHRQKIGVLREQHASELRRSPKKGSIIQL